MSETPAERSAKARSAALIRWAHTPDRTAATAAARAAMINKFETLADPDNKLSPSERAAAGDRLRRAHLSDMARRSSRSRRDRAVTERKSA